MSDATRIDLALSGCRSARSRQVSDREALVLAPLVILALLRGFCGTLAGRQCSERRAYDVIRDTEQHRQRTTTPRNTVWYRTDPEGRWMRIPNMLMR